MRGQQEEKERSPGKLSVRDRARTQVDHGGVGLGVSVWGVRAGNGCGWVGGCKAVCDVVCVWGGLCLFVCSLCFYSHVFPASFTVTESSPPRGATSRTRA